MFTVLSWCILHRRDGDLISFFSAVPVQMDDTDPAFTVSATTSMEVHDDLQRQFEHRSRLARGVLRMERIAAYLEQSSFGDVEEGGLVSVDSSSSHDQSFFSAHEGEAAASIILVDSVPALEAPETGAAIPPQYTASPVRAAELSLSPSRSQESGVFFSLPEADGGVARGFIMGKQDVYALLSYNGTLKWIPETAILFVPPLPPPASSLGPAGLAKPPRGFPRTEGTSELQAGPGVANSSFSARAESSWATPLAYGTNSQPMSSLHSGLQSSSPPTANLSSVAWPSQSTPLNLQSPAQDFSQISARSAHSWPNRGRGRGRGRGAPAGQTHVQLSGMFPQQGRALDAGSRTATYKPRPDIPLDAPYFQNSLTLKLV